MKRLDACAHDGLELDLERALAWEPAAAAWALLDRRVRALPTARNRVETRWWRRPIALLAAAALLMGAARILTLVQQAAQGIPGHVVAYERGKQLDLTRMAGEYSVTLQRAYADPNQLVLAFSVAGPAGAGPIVPRADVVDSAGRHYLEFAGGDATDTATAGSGSILAFDVPPGARGVERLTVTVPYLMATANGPEPTVDSPLTYSFEIPFAQATTVAPDQAVTVNGRTIELRWLRVSATAARFRLDTDLSGLARAPGTAWIPEATIRHGRGPDELLSWTAMPPGWIGQPKSQMQRLFDDFDGSTVIYQAMSGTDDPSGSWTIRVDRLTGLDGAGARQVVEGPWVFTVVVP